MYFTSLATFLFLSVVSATVTMNRNGDLLLHSLLNGNIVFSTGTGGIKVETNGQTIDLLQAINQVNSLAGQMCWLSPPHDRVTWRAEVNVPFPLMDPAVVSVNEDIYVIGGSNGITTLNTVLIYSTTLRTWRFGQNMTTPRSRAFASASTDGTKIFVFGGGVYESQDEDYVSSPISTYEVYDVSRDQWRTQFFTNSTSPTMPFHHFKGSSTVIGDLVFFFGGVSSGNIRSGNVSAFSMTNFYWDLSWPVMPDARFKSAASSIGQTAYVIGGKSQIYDSKFMDSLDTVSRSWTTRAEYGLPKENMQSVNINNLVYLIGGRSEFTQYSNTEVDVYNARVNLWANNLVAPMSFPRDGFGATVIQNRVYVFGGRSDSG